MPATFADISWGSDMASAIAQMQSKGFTVLEKVSTMIRAEGKIFHRNSRIFLTFNQTGLYEVAIFVDVKAGHAVTEYDKMASILSQKYGIPILENADGSIWQNHEATGGTEIVLNLASDETEISVFYVSPEKSLSELNRYKENQKTSKDLF